LTKKAPTIELDALPIYESRRRVREAVEALIEWCAKPPVSREGSRIEIYGSAFGRWG
jgi:hypothetical protein